MIGVLRLELECITALRKRDNDPGFNVKRHMRQFQESYRSPEHFGDTSKEYDGSWGVASYKGKKVLDLGCDNGSSSEYFLSKGATHVVAVDCDDKMFAELEENAIGKEITPVKMKVTTREDFTGLIHEHMPDVIKCDIEGWEVHFLEMDRDVVRLVPEYLFEIHALNGIEDDPEVLDITDKDTTTVLTHYKMFKEFFVECGYSGNAYHDDYCVIFHVGRKEDAKDK